MHSRIFTGFLRPSTVFHPRFYGQKNILTLRFFTGEESMDIPYVVAGALLWLAMVLMVKGLEKLEKPKGERA